MSATLKSRSSSYSQSTSERVETRPDCSPIYFTNRGLFSDNYLMNRLPDSSNEPTILLNWETEDLPEFSACYEWMLGTWEQYKDILPSLDEAQLEDKWIRPILTRLGWTYEVQDRLKRHGKTQIPDYSLFQSIESYKRAKGCKTDNAYFENVLAIADAKAMGVNLDGTSRSNSNPSYQIVRYLEDTGREWGILTDGEYWRLYSTKPESRYATYYEVSIRKMLARRDDEQFKYFFNFFRRAAFERDSKSGQCFLDIVYAGGEVYAQEVETQLKHRAFRIVEAICKGFSSSKRTMSEPELKSVYEHSLYYLFRLMFVLNCEAKGLLDTNELSDYFPFSLRRLCRDLKEDFEANRTWSNQCRTYNQVQDLFDLIENGDQSIGVFGFGSEMFSGGNADFYRKNRIPDHLLNEVLVNLACSYDDQGTLKFIDYKRLSADHLGSLFEGLLEYKLAYATERLAIDASGAIVDEEKVNSKRFKNKVTKIDIGDLYLSNSSQERKDSGSYYTPEYIVDYIVKETVAPICEGKSVDEILKLKFADPAAGSGHFLLGLVRYLEERILDQMYKFDQKETEINPAEVRWKILHSCIYGFDINPLAVELTKFSLWMYTARRGFELEPLSDQVICQDSLAPAEVLRKQVQLKRGFDAIVGNPPYVRQESLIGTKEHLETRFSVHHSMADLYVYFIEQSTNLLDVNGRCGLITANKWMRSEYGTKLRTWFKTAGLHKIVDFGDLPVFRGVAAYPCILLLNKRQERSVQYVKVRKLPTSRDERIFTADPEITVATKDLNDGGWSFLTPAEHSIMKKLSKASVDLDTAINSKVFYGIKTGCNDAFVVSKEVADGLIRQDRRSAEIIKPFASGREIGRYAHLSPKEYVILTRRGIDLSKYPAVEKYLQQYKTKLVPKPKGHKGKWPGRKPGSYKWYEIQDTVDYIGSFYERKICYLVFQTKPAFTFDRKGVLNNNAVWNIGSDDLFLLGFLNSKLGWHQISKVCTEIRGGYQLIYKYFRKVRVPNKSVLPLPAVRKIEELVADRLKLTAGSEKALRLENKIDSAFYSLFDLNAKEIAVLEDLCQSWTDAPTPDLDDEAA